MMADCDGNKVHKRYESLKLSHDAEVGAFTIETRKIVTEARLTTASP